MTQMGTMFRSALGKVAWVGRTASMVFGLALVLALVFGVTTMAFGADGQSFLLGRSNLATALTKLTGNVDGAALQVANSNAGANDTALSLSVEAGEAPMRVNSDNKVANLNADKLDNLNPSQIKGARAYAVVNPGGPGGTPAFDAGRTSGFTRVERTNPGEYCLRAQGLSSDNRPAVVSVDWANTAAPEATASAMLYTPGCSNGGFRVFTERVELNGGALNDAASDAIGFVIVVP